MSGPQRQGWSSLRRGRALATGGRSPSRFPLLLSPTQAGPLAACGAAGLAGRDWSRRRTGLSAAGLRRGSSRRRRHRSGSRCGGRTLSPPRNASSSLWAVQTAQRGAPERVARRFGAGDRWPAAQQGRSWAGPRPRSAGAVHDGPRRQAGRSSQSSIRVCMHARSGLLDHRDVFAPHVKLLDIKGIL